MQTEAREVSAIASIFEHVSVLYEILCNAVPMSVWAIE